MFVSAYKEYMFCFTDCKLVFILVLEIRLSAENFKWFIVPYFMLQGEQWRKNGKFKKLTYAVMQALERLSSGTFSWNLTSKRKPPFANSKLWYFHVTHFRIFYMSNTCIIFTQYPDKIQWLDSLWEYTYIYSSTVDNTFLCLFF